MCPIDHEADGLADHAGSRAKQARINVNDLAGKAGKGRRIVLVAAKDASRDIHLGWTRDTLLVQRAFARALRWYCKG